jgi:hypothetical protein
MPSVVEEVTSRSAADRPSEPQLRELAQAHRMRYRVATEWGPDKSWRQQRIGFTIDLRGSQGPDAEGLLGSERSRADTRAALRSVAEWAVDIQKPQVCATIDGYPDELEVDQRGDWAVTLHAHVLHRGDVRRAVDHDENEFVQQVRGRLASLGVTEN